MKIIRLILIHLLKYIFKIRRWHKHFFGIYKRIIQPTNLCRDIQLNHLYDGKYKLKLNLEDWIQVQIFFTGYADLRGVNYMKKNLQPGDTFIDVGANIGTYSLIASNCVGTSGKVFAFEPAGSTYNTLTTNIKNNKIQHIFPVKKALSDSTEKKTLYLSDSENSGLSSFHIQENDVSNTEIVDCTTLDQFVEQAELSSIKLIKIDIEGAEYEALLGMDKILSSFRPILFIEINDEIIMSLNREKNDIEILLRKYNYSKYIIDDDGNILKNGSYTDGYKNYVFLPD